MPTTTTTIAKAQLVHPDYGYIPTGSDLHTYIRSLYTLLGNQVNIYWSGSNVLANTGTLTVTHNLSTALTSLFVRIFESGVPISLASQAANYTIAQTNTNVITVVNNSGTSKTIEVYVSPLFYIGSANLDAAFLATLATLTAAQTLTNKTLGSTNTLTGATAASFTNGGTITLPSGTLTLATLTGTEAFTNKDHDGGTASNTSRFTIPKGTFSAITALTRKQGTILYASDQDVLYSDNGTSLSPIGGNWSVASAASVTSGGTIAISLTTGLQLIPVSGSGGAQTTSLTPFGTTAPSNGVVVRLLGTSNTNTVTIGFNDATKGILLNGDVTLGRGSSIDFQYNSTLDLWVEVCRNAMWGV